MVQRFLSLLGSGLPEQTQLDMLSADVRYDWLVGQPLLVKRSLVGLAEVAGYLSILPRTYQILEADEKTIYAVGNKVVAIGGECAKIVRTDQVVHTDWVAVFDIAANRIASITMSVYRWTLLKDAWLKGLPPHGTLAAADHSRSRPGLSLPDIAARMQNFRPQ